MRTFAAVCLSALLAAPLTAQNFATSPCEHTDSHGGWFSGEHICEVRKTTLPFTGQLTVTGRNGGIEVIGEERQDIALEARVTAQGSDRDDAMSFLRQIKIVVGSDIHAEGPESWLPSRHNWSVDFKLHVPRTVSQAKLQTENGGIAVTDLHGEIQARTTNGGMTLDDLAGDVHATTVNGGITVHLAGHQWQGAGLVARSTNGGVSVKTPEGYSAHLVAHTTNGGVSVGFPVTMQGKLNNNRIDSNIGQGGPTVEFETVNGGVSIHAD